jgi:8-oxo-dGTP pyrophosphatase MutT (NUDIX family)
MPETVTEVAIAILYQNNQFLMQLRDDIPGIRYPGHWGLFGGHLEPGESPEIAMRRELLEEICFTPQDLNLFKCDRDPQVLRYVYHGNLTVDLSDLVLAEGWDLALLSPEEIQRGDRYSLRAAQVRPLGAPHQRLLLEFMQSNSWR